MSEPLNTLVLLGFLVVCIGTGYGCRNILTKPTDGPALLLIKQLATGFVAANLTALGIVLVYIIVGISITGVR